MIGARQGDAPRSGRDRPQRIGRWLCLAGVAFGATGLLEALVGAGPWALVFPHEPPMHPTTALGLVLISGAGALRYREDARQVGTTLSVVAALAVLAVGTGTLAEHALGLELRFTQLFSRAAPGASPVRPPPFTAMAFTVLATAILLLDVRTSARAGLSAWCALAGAFLSFTSLLGFLFGAGVLDPLAHAPLIGMAPPTAVGLLLTSAGLLLVRPRTGLMRVATAPGPGGLLLRRLVPGTILGPGLLGLVLVLALRALGAETSVVLGAILAASTALTGLLLLVLTVAPLNRAYEALEASRARIRELVEQAPDGIFIADLGGRYTEVNDAGCRMLGFTREEIVGKEIMDLIPADRLDELARQKARILRGEEVVAEWVLRKKDGTWLPVEVSTKVLPDGRWQGFVRDISEHERLEAALRAANAHLVRAQSVAEVGSWRFDVRRDILEWSDEEYRIFGVAPGTPMTYEAFIVLVHPDDRAYVAEAWTAALLRGAPYDIEHRIVVDGAVRWVREKADLELGEDRSLVAALGVTLHITERVQREQALRLSEATAAGILSISADAIISIDEQQRITLFNEGAEKIFGYTKAEALGAPLEMLLPERFRAAHRRHVERFAAGDTAARHMGDRGTEICGLSKSGEEFPADAAISKLLVDGTRILTVALRNVGEQKRRENEQRILAEAGSLLASTLDLDATLESIGQLATRTAELCVIYVAERDTEARRLRAFSRDPALGALREALERLPLDRRQVPEIWAALDGNQSVLMESVSPEQLAAFARDEEHQRTLRAVDPSSIIMAPLFARGTLIGAMALVARAPARSYGPDDLRFAEQLAQRAAYAVDNAQLYAIARRALQARDNVLGIVAHDLRNPLGTILLQASLLHDPGAGEEHRLKKRAAGIERSARRMGRMIEDLLDVTRIEEGRLSIVPAWVSAGQVISEAVEAQRPAAAAASLELELEVARDLPEVWADPDRLLQVFENLIGNAMKFTEPGGLIKVGAALRGREVLFWVADTGAGIGAEKLPHVFDRFWQEWEGDRRGVGIGLAIVKGIVEAHGGRVCMESTLGQGTTLYFSIPTEPPTEPPAQPPGA